MNLGRPLAEGFAVDTELEEPQTGPIEIVPETVEVDVPAEPATV